MSALWYPTSMTFSALNLPSCREPMFTTGSLKEAASTIPLDEFPTIAEAKAIMLKYACVPRLSTNLADVCSRTNSSIIRIIARPPVSAFGMVNIAGMFAS